MLLLKKILIILTISGSAGVFSTYSTVVSASEDLEGARKATIETIEDIERGIGATKKGFSAQTVLSFVSKAIQHTKDITGETITEDLQNASDALIRARRSLKTVVSSDYLTEEEQAIILAALEEALEIFQIIKTKLFITIGSDPVPNQNCRATYYNGVVHFPCVDIQNAAGETLETYDVYMNIVPGSNPLEFEVDSVEPAMAEVAPPKITGATTVDTMLAKSLHDQEVTFVDVRSEADYKSGHIEGAKNLNIKEGFSSDALSAIVSKDKPVVFYCDGPLCTGSAVAAKIALEWGWTKVFYFRDGLAGWEKAGLPTKS